MKKCILLLASIVLIGLWAGKGDACTSFQLNQNGQVVVGKNYDWMVAEGLIMVNKRGVAKTALMPNGRENVSDVPATWTSQYGSISFNQYGRERLAGGMNEAGLVVESMGLFENSRFPRPDERPCISMHQWMQYQLDNAVRVQDVLDSDKFVRIQPRKGVHIHYLVSDRAGDCAVIEFIDGKMVCRTNESLPYAVLTNDTYDASLDYLRRDEIPAPDKYRSIERFIKATKMVEGYHSNDTLPPVDQAFDVLKSVQWSARRTRRGVSWTTHTRWSIVYDSTNLRIHFRTFDNPRIRQVDFRAFDFSCAAPVQVLDINAPLAGNVSGHFVDYTTRMNRDLIETAYNNTVYLPRFPDEWFDALSRYPETTRCDH